MRYAILILALCCAPLPFARADDWDEAEQDVEKLQKELVKILGKAAPGSAGEAAKTLSEMQKALERGIKFLNRNRRKDEARAAGKYLDLLEDMGKGPVKALGDLMGDFEDYRKRTDAFARKARKSEAQLLGTLDDLVGELRSAAARVKSGREDPGAALALIDGWQKKGESTFDDRLGDLAKEAEKLFGKGAPDLTGVLRQAKRAKSARGGVKAADQIVRALKSGVARWEKEIDTHVDGLREQFGDLLGGVKGHRGVRAKKDEIDALVATFKGSGASAKTFERDERLVTIAAGRIAASVKSSGSLPGRDLDAVRKRLDGVFATCRKHRISPPDWAEDARKIMGALEGAGLSLQELAGGLEAAEGEAAKFREECDKGLREIGKLVDGVESFEDVIAAKRKMDRMESRFEADFKRLEKSLSEVEKSAEGLLRLPKKRGPGEAILAAARDRADAAQRTVKELKADLAGDRAVEAMLEGYDGR